MLRSRGNINRLGFVLGALLFLLASTTTQACSLDSGQKTASTPMACCHNNSTSSSNEPCCCRLNATRIYHHAQWQNCSCVAPSQPASLWQSQSFAPAFVHSSHSPCFEFRKTQIAFENAFAITSTFNVGRFLSRAPPLFLSS